MRFPRAPASSSVQPTGSGACGRRGRHGRTGSGTSVRPISRRVWPSNALSHAGPVSCAHRPATTADRPERKHHTWHCSWTPTPSRAASRRVTSRPPTRPTSRRRARTASATCGTGSTRARARSSASWRHRTPRRPTRSTARPTGWWRTRSTPSASTPEPGDDSSIRAGRGRVAHLPHDPGLCHADPMTVQAARGGRWVGAPGLVVRLLGRPGIERRGDEPYRLRSRKSWALLTYLLLTEHPHSRGRLAELLFAEADDPLRALRWSLAEIRRALADHGSVEGDPVALTLADDVLVDVVELSHGSWVEAMEVAGAGGELLDGPVLRGAPAFESWLLSERRRLASATESVLHEAALGLLARGELDRARGFAVRAAAMSPLDENHQALVIRLYRLSGDDDAAERQYGAFARLLDTELGVGPCAVVEAARHERPRAAVEVTTDRAVEAVIESGSAAIAAGAIDPGITSLRSAVPLADADGATHLRVESRLALAEALIHSVRGLDEEGQAHLHEADRLALDHGDLATVAQARAELGYVDFLRARYDRAELWLTDAIEIAQGSPEVLAKATTYLGSVHSDRGSYPQAIALLDQAARLSHAAD